MVVILRASPANHIRFSYKILFKQSWTPSSVNKEHIKTKQFHPMIKLYNLIYMPYLYQLVLENSFPLE